MHGNNINIIILRKLCVTFLENAAVMGTRPTWISCLILSTITSYTILNGFY